MPWPMHLSHISLTPRHYDRGEAPLPSPRSISAVVYIVSLRLAQIPLRVTIVTGCLGFPMQQLHELSPASRLPAEILHEIFFYVGQFRQSPPICKVIHRVCRRWRHVAYDVKYLWTDVPLDSQIWTQLALNFSCQEPISIVLHAPIRSSSENSRAPPGLESALPHLPRVREIVLKKLYLSRVDLGFLVYAGLPLLERLCLQSCKYWFELPEGLFTADGAPRLVHLTLHRLCCTAPIRFKLLRPTLQSLELYHCRDVFVNTPGHISLNLERLHIVHSCPDENTTLLTRIHILKSRHLYIQDTSVKISKLMRHLTFDERKTEVNLDCEIYHQNDIRPLLLHLRQRIQWLTTLGTLDPIVPRAPCVLYISDPVTSVSQSPGLMLSAIHEVTAPWKVSMFFEHRFLPSYISRIASTMLNMEVLDVDSSLFGSYVNWISIFLHMPLLAAIHARGEAAHGLVKFFIHLWPMVVGEKLAPRLVELSLYNVKFPLAHDGEEEGSVSFSGLTLALDNLRSATHRIRVSFKNCTVNQDMVGRLRCQLGDAAVEWDDITAGV
ncbi:hypothetical protein BC834DRAFT_281630 [Gloeopeniophorella convolvens]|nr:hypothetical protein BC834DRAFT_281630 [Gloeopeniophorella convolvens]